MFETKTPLEQRNMINKKGKSDFSDKELRRKLPMVAMLNSWRQMLRTTNKSKIKIPLLECVQEKPPVPTEENLKKTRNEQYLRALLMKNSPCSPVSEEVRKRFEPIKVIEKAPAINEIVLFEIKALMNTGKITSHFVSIIAQIEAHQKENEEKELPPAVVEDPKPVKKGRKARAGKNSDAVKSLDTIKENFGQEKKAKQSKLVVKVSGRNLVGKHSTSLKSVTESIESRLHHLEISKTPETKNIEKAKRVNVAKKPVAAKVKENQQIEQSHVNVSVVNTPIKINCKITKTEKEKTELIYRRSERLKKLVEQTKAELRVAIEKNNLIQRSDVKREIVKHTRRSFDNAL